MSRDKPAIIKHFVFEKYLSGVKTVTCQGIANSFYYPIIIGKQNLNLCTYYQKEPPQERAECQSKEV
jgi:hypothetical protein